VQLDINAQQRKVFELMIDGKWRSLREIEDATGVPGASAQGQNARFSEPRISPTVFRFGEPEDARRREGGIWLYRLTYRT
jgi:hypothetical protein